MLTPVLERPVPAGTGNPAPRRVLVVEDNAVHQAMLGAMLGILGCDCIVAAGVTDALASLADQDFDVVLMDVQLPDVDGFAGAREITSLGAGAPPVVAMTAGADRRDCLAAGMTDYLQKPVALEDLARVVTS